MPTRTELDAAGAAGHATAAAGGPVTACPYAAQRTPQERALALAWVGAYLAERPPAPGDVDHDDDTAREP
ncbi:hypothetical protein ACIBSW_06845 [Actinoplanes sp. NPDC049668]|uniref:hypothetical protein n=1 Tax=unclassified Actinoplanes TaxID=2626549 RepID=UPI0033A161DF